MEAKDKFAGTALSRAAGNGQLEAARMLIDAGADVNVREWENGFTPIGMCKEGAKYNDFDPDPIVDLLKAASGTE